MYDVFRTDSADAVQGLMAAVVLGGAFADLFVELSEAKVNVAWYENSSELVESVTNSDAVDLVLLTFMLRDAVSATSISERIREIKPSARVCLATDQAVGDIQKQRPDQGWFDCFLPLSPTVDQVLQLLDRNRD